MEYLLKRYKKLNQKERKGFTLVELLVVIAILAVLASVSVVGYLGFTAKAKHSNAMTELSQAKEVIRASLIDGDTHYYKYESSSKKWSSTDETSTNKPLLSLKYAEGLLTYTFVDSTDANNNSNGSGLSWDDAFKGIFTDLATFSGEFQAQVDSTNSKTISSIKYFGKNGGKAQWTIKDDLLSNGDSITEETTKTVTATTSEQ